MDDSVKNTAVEVLANNYFNNSSVSEVFALVPFHVLVKLAQDKVVEQARLQVDEMSDDEIAELLKPPPAPAEAPPPAPAEAPV